MFVYGHNQLADRRAELVGQLFGFSNGRTDHENRELFAAPTRHMVGLSYACRQGVAHGTKHLVAHLVSMRVVDLFEVVDIAQDQ